jgi:hypothetical protein
MSGKLKTKKSGKTANEEKGPKQGTLPLPAGGKYKQQKVDGSGTLRETTEPEIQEAADYWFGKKVEEARAKDNSKKAGEKLLLLMESANKTSVIVFNSDLQKKVRVNILQGADKLKVEKEIGPIA